MKTTSTLATSRIHFMASSIQGGRELVKDVDVDLAIELSETNKVKDGRLISTVLGALPSAGDVPPAQTGMQKFWPQAKKGTLTLATALKPAAYPAIVQSGGNGAGTDATGRG